MLRQLYVRDLALVREADLKLETGMTAITGETGAGKSLLVDALLMLAGARADASLVRQGAERAEVSGTFDLGELPRVRDDLAARELDDGDGQQAVLRRVLHADGGSRAYINGRPVAVGELRDVASQLVELHGQQEHLRLLDRAAQLDLIDRHAGSLSELGVVREAAGRVARLAARLEAIGDGDALARERDRLVEELARLDGVALEPAAVADLFARQRRLAHAGETLAALDRALTELDDDSAVLAGTTRLASELQKLAEFDPLVRQAAELVESASIELGEAAALVREASDELELDPEALAETEARLSALHDLARRHRVEIEALPEVQTRIAAEIAQLDADGTDAEAVRADLERAQADWSAAAELLTAKRLEAARTLSDGVNETMARIGMEGGRFVAGLVPQAGKAFAANGAETVEFEVAPSAAQALANLKRTASGGELSRISLALAIAAIGADPVPVMVFDEVDTGVGGAVAEAVGQLLRALGGRHQVLCVTHLPQVAAQAHAQLKVGKSDEGTQVQALSDQDRVEEIARMLGGATIDAATRKAARAALDRTRSKTT